MKQQNHLVSLDHFRPGNRPVIWPRNLQRPPFQLNYPSTMPNNGYDVVVDVDDEGDLGHTDLADLEFHQSSTPAHCFPDRAFR